MSKAKPFSSKLTDKVLMIGYSRDGLCVHSSFTTARAFWENAHFSDYKEQVKAISLYLVRGYIFDAKGKLEQKFERYFDPETGIYTNGWDKNDNGHVYFNQSGGKETTFRRDPPDMTVELISEKNQNGEITTTPVITDK